MTDLWIGASSSVGVLQGMSGVWQPRCIYCISRLEEVGSSSCSRSDGLGCPTAPSNVQSYNGARGTCPVDAGKALGSIDSPGRPGGQINWRDLCNCRICNVLALLVHTAHPAPPGHA
jgi:hypothetical protein